jgi:tRNA threonylcarbamoyladenosine biosynthesis protein TsaB
MLVLLLKTNQERARLYLYEQDHKLAEHYWRAGKNLAETINLEIERLLSSANKTLNSLDGIGVYGGPGSFTGLRIGISLANALAYSLQVAVVKSSGSNWKQQALNRLTSGDNEYIVVPDYGAAAKITTPRK